MRETIVLNGTWELSYDSVNYDKSITIPGSIPITEESYPDPESLTGYFRKTVHLVPAQLEKRKFITFYGSDLRTEVWINGENVGEHHGGFDAFSFDITGQMNQPENEILVKVEDFPIEELKNEVIGKQDWYGNITGMWQPVVIELFEETFIRSTDFNIGMDEISVKLDIEGPFENVKYTLKDHGEVLKEGVVEETAFNIQREGLNRWSPDNPQRYVLTVSILNNGSVVDKIVKKTGFRAIKQENGKLYLNGRPFYMKGLLDQDYYPETDYVHPSREFIGAELRRVKALGYNTIRYHVKTPPADYVDLADEIGLMLWIDLPYAKAFNEASKQYLGQLRDDLMKRYSASPSFCIMTLINESWGIDLSAAGENDWLSGFWTESKEKVKDRLIVDNSACHGNHHVRSDINDYHFYFSHPENKVLWDKNIKDFSDNTFLPFEGGFPENPPEELPKIISEFGVWSLSDPGLWTGEWMHYPLLGIKKIREFKDNALDPNASALFKKLQWQGYYALKHQIEEMRRHDAIQGFVLTELSDIAWEANGILDYARNDKPFTPYLKRLNQDLLPIMSDKGEICVSNITNETVEGGMRVELNSETIRTRPFKAGRMATDFIDQLELLPKEGLLTIKLITSGRVVGLNTYNLHHFSNDPGEMVLYHEYNNEALEAAKSGKKVYVQLNTPKDYDDFEIVQNTTSAKEGTGLTWAGDWIGGFFHYHPLMLKSLAYEHGARELEGTFTGVVIVNPSGYETLIGKTLGWDLAQCALLMRKKIGKGEIIISTLNLTDSRKLSIIP